MEQVSDNNLHESLPSEPPDIGNWFSSYVYESPLLDTSDGLELSVPGESECIKETEAEKETTEIERNKVCSSLFEQDLVSSAKVTDFSESQSALSEPPDVRNWFSSYEYQTPLLSDTQELGFSAFEKDKLIIDESDSEEENSCGIFRKTKSKQETITLDRSNSNDYKEKIAADKAKEISSDHSYPDQQKQKQLSVGSFHASKTEVKSASKREASLHELSPKDIEETIFMNSNRQKSPTDQESDDKENIPGQITETGFVSMKKARDRFSMTKPITGGLVKCSRSKESKNVAKEEDKDERKKKRKVLGEMSNHQFSKFKEITGKWCCPQKRKGNIVTPLKQLRLDAWIHKV